MNNFNYTIEETIAIGVRHVVYRDIETGETLGGWETMCNDEEIDEAIKKNRERLLEIFYGNERIVDDKEM